MSARGAGPGVPQGVGEFVPFGSCGFALVPCAWFPVPAGGHMGPPLRGGMGACGFWGGWFFVEPVLSCRGGPMCPPAVQGRGFPKGWANSFLLVPADSHWCLARGFPFLRADTWVRPYEGGWGLAAFGVAGFL